MLKESGTQPSTILLGGPLTNPTPNPINFIFFKSERMYAHRMIRFNYTTYDIRRSQDVVNPRTPHCNIMLLNKQMDDNDTTTAHPFLYARVIGIYHVNVIYTGPGMINYSPTRFDILWVRWYQHIPPTEPHRLDQLTFPDVMDENAFGFVDPADVLRGCHIIPAFCQDQEKEKEIPEARSKARSKCAHSLDDFKGYYVGQ